MEIYVDKAKEIIIISKAKYDEVDIVKNIPVRTWNSKEIQWELPICRNNIRYLSKYESFITNPEIKKIYDFYVEDARIKRIIDSIEDIPINFSKYKINPYKYQKEGIYFCTISSRAIIADEPGLGKTMQAIIAADILYKDGKIIIICPRTLVGNWANEINKVIGYCDPKESMKSILKKSPIYIASGFSYEPIPDDKKWIICGYSQFTPDSKNDVAKRTWSQYFLSGIKIDTLILDEAHRVKNPKANRTRNIRMLSKKCHNLIMLSGTLMLNNIEELWSPLNMISPNDFPHRKSFCDKYMKSFDMNIKKKTKYGTVLPLTIKKYYGIKNENELKNIIRPFIIRRLKSDVFAQLPPKSRVFIPLQLPIEHKKEYDQMYEDFVEYLIRKGELDRALKASRAVQLVQSMALMEFISSIKAYMAEDIIDELLTYGKVVAFCHYKSSADILYNLFKDRAYKITGDIMLGKRQLSIDEFKRSSINNLLILTYGAGSEGFNLEEASNMVMIDFNWVPAVMLQAEDRIHRITSKDPVTIRYLYIDDTIDGIIYRAVTDKLTSIDRIMSMDKNIIEDFSAKLKEELAEGHK